MSIVAVLEGLRLQSKILLFLLLPNTDTHTTHKEKETTTIKKTQANKKQYKKSHFFSGFFSFLKNATYIFKRTDLFFLQLPIITLISNCSLLHIKET